MEDNLLTKKKISFSAAEKNAKYECDQPVVNRMALTAWIENLYNPIENTHNARKMFKISVINYLVGIKEGRCESRHPTLGLQLFKRGSRTTARTKKNIFSSYAKTNKFALNVL